jgi:sulfhydrogenase subunit beta (sulfur reductase)
MATFYLAENNLGAFLEALCRDGEVYGTVERESRLRYELVTADNARLVSLRPSRSYASPKSLLYPVSQKVAAYAGAPGVELEPVKEAERVIVGLRWCDLAAIRMHDRVMLEGEYIDTFYKARRDATTLISADCAEACPSCFCTMMEGQPWPTGLYDLNVSPLASGYLAEAGSAKGEALLEKHKALFAPATDAQIAERDAKREAVRAKVVEQNREFEPDVPIREVFAGEIDQARLQKLAFDCVECGACTNVCPSCYCFLTFERPVEGKEKSFERGREWDSCQFAEYHRMAGAGGVKPNPKPFHRNRFVHRFNHKYWWFQEQFGQFQCSGCGRCFDACSGAIDPRRVIKEMSKSKKP